MADTFGSLAYPADPDTGALSDPALDKFGAFIAAVINANLGGVWLQKFPGSPPIKGAPLLGNPEVTTLNERDLPSLFVWRQHMQQVRETDEWHTDHSTIHVLWTPPAVTQAVLGGLVPFFNGVTKCIFRAITLGRDPAWVDPGDEDPDARSLGSALTERAGLLYPPEITQCEPYLLKLQSDTQSRKYPSVLAKIKAVESTYWDPSLRGTPAAHTTSLENNGVGLVELQDPLE